MAPCERHPPRQGVAAKKAAECRRVLAGWLASSSSAQFGPMTKEEEPSFGRTVGSYSHAFGKLAFYIDCFIKYSKYDAN